MINKYSLKYKIADFFAKKLLNNQTDCYFFSEKERASVLIKIIFKNNGKVLVAKKIQEESLSKVCLPYGYVDLASFTDNSKTCAQIAFNKMNISLDEFYFDKPSLIDVKLNYEENESQLVYVYSYDLSDKEFSKISDSYSFYDFFLLDLTELNEYNIKRRFVDDLDFVILNKLKKKECECKK